MKYLIKLCAKLFARYEVYTDCEFYCRKEYFYDRKSAIAYINEDDCRHDIWLVDRKWKASCKADILDTSNEVWVLDIYEADGYTKIKR